MELIILLLIPTAGALLTAVMPARLASRTAFFITLANAVVTAFALHKFDSAGGVQFEVNKPWLPFIGSAFHIGADGINMLMVLLTNFLMPVIMLTTLDNRGPGMRGAFALMLFMQAGMLLVFTAMDGFLFYIGWEAALIPIYFIIGRWGGEHRVQANVKFFIYTIAGSLLMLTGLIYLRYQNPAHNFDMAAFYQLHLPVKDQWWLFWVLFAAFAVKMPVFPLHTWQPDTYTQAPAFGSMLLAGIMLKMGIYGTIKWLLPVVPQGFDHWAGLVLALAITGVVYGAVIAIRRNHMKRVIAYSSLGHVGLIAAGVFSLNYFGLQGAMVQMLSHGINVIGLFLVADIIYKRLGTFNLKDLGGIAIEMPTLAMLFLILLLGSIALPGTNGFVGEFLLLTGIFKYNIWAAIVAGLTVILSAVYMYRMYQRSMLGELVPAAKDFRPLRANEFLALAALCIGVLYIGIYPKHVQDLTAPAVTGLIDMVNAKLTALR